MKSGFLVRRQSVVTPLHQCRATLVEPLNADVRFKFKSQFTSFELSRRFCRDRVSLTSHCTAGNGADSAPPQEGWWTKNVPDNMTPISTVQELVDQLAEASRNDELVVLEVFAPWCGACKALFHKMKKICKEHKDVKFLLLNFEDNRKMAKGLGVKVLPFFHFYRGPSGKVGEMTCSISKINKLKDAIEVHKSPRCYLQDINDVVLKEYPDITPSNMTRVSSASSTEETLAAQS